MYLKSLELQGFKSFPDKTKLTFEAGATVIVGPNGSGKSNISDAMRWVLGEISSKNIRGTKMEDIIFGGADSRKPMGYAEVSVTFDNRSPENRLDCTYDEVTVTRRYYRSGDSEYYINRVPVRLKDIYELFMNTGIGRDGYSIVGQGKIAEIISRKSDERRSIFEDASGIAKYRHKKNEAERRLAETDDNMTRINDVFLEVSAQVGPLEKEAEKATRALELIETKKRVDVQLWLFDTDKLRAEIAEAEDLYNHSSFDLSTVNDTIASFEAQSEKLFNSSQNNKFESEQLRTKIGEQTEINHTLDSEYQVAGVNIRNSVETMANANDLLSVLEKNLVAEKETLSAHNGRIRELEQTLASLTASHGEAVAKQEKMRAEAQKLDEGIATALEDIRSAEKEITETRVRLSVIENAKKTDGGKNDAILGEIRKYDEITASLEARIAACEKTVENYGSQIADLEKEIADLSALLEEKENARRENDEKIAGFGHKRDAALQRAETIRAMEEQLEGYPNSVRFVMKAYDEGRIIARDGGKCGKIWGPLSKVISTEEKYIAAIETALGANLGHIVVENEETAKAAMAALKAADAGRATFFPVTSMRGQDATHEMEESRKYKGFISYADELVACDGKFREIVSSLLGRTVVFDNIDNATEMAKALRYHVQVVTLGGEQIRVGGSFTGGSVRTRGGMLGRAGEIRRLEEEAASLEKEMASLEKVNTSLGRDIEEAENDRKDKDEKRRLLDIMAGSERATLEKHRAQLDANNTLAGKLRSDWGDVIEQNRRYDEEYESLTARDRELSARIAEITEYRTEKDIEHNSLLDAVESVGNEITDLWIRVSDTRKDIETETTLATAIGERVRAAEDGIAEQNRRISECRARVAQFETSERENREKYAEGQKILDELKEQYKALENDSFEFEKKLGALNAKLRDKRAEKDVILRENMKNENRLAGLRAEQDKLATRLWDEYEITRAEAVALGYPPITKVTRAAAAAKQVECRNKLRAIGSVDLDAVNKYKEVKERYDKMDRQIRDLNASRTELLKIIDGLEGEMKTAFIESFNRINENFGQTFSELFGGGTAELSLTEPENVLESGIEIKAAPPGKIIKSLMQLSGGEQSFIAIALLFAILKVSPPPFCIMDEIEAALDEVNVVRLSEYIKRYASETQFIMITHRRGTMEAANKLYGVTMPEHGISKVLALDVADIAKKKGEEWNGIFG